MGLPDKLELLESPPAGVLAVPPVPPVALPLLPLLLLHPATSVATTAAKPAVRSTTRRLTLVLRNVLLFTSNSPCCPAPGPVSSTRWPFTESGEA
jgi:hypothetical protein